MDAASDRARRTGPRELSVAVTQRYRFMWGLNRLLVGILFDVRASGLEHLPEPPFQLVANHHNGFDPMLVVAVTPLEPRIAWFVRARPTSAAASKPPAGFFGGVIPYNPDKTTLTSAVRAVRRVFEADGVLGIFAEGRIGFRESELLPFEDGARPSRSPRASRSCRARSSAAPTSGSGSGSMSASGLPSRPMVSAAERHVRRSRRGFARPSVRSCLTQSRACRDAGRSPALPTSSMAPRTWRVARAAAASIGSAYRIVWTLFVVCAVGGFLMIAAYWLDVQDRPDLDGRGRIAWSAAVIVFPISIPIYAFAGGPNWPLALRVGSLVPGIALLPFAGFLFGIFA